MKRLTREERRRIQRRAANIRFLAFVLILLALGVCIGYTAAHAQNACEPPKPQEVSQPSPVDDTPQEPAEQPAEDYSSLRISSRTPAAPSRATMWIFSSRAMRLPANSASSR